MSGYYRYPTIHENKIVFVSENDLWIVDRSNLIATRLTSNIGEVTSPLFSPDGTWIAYVGREDGNTEIYLMPSTGGISKRLTYDGGFISKIASWDGNNIIYASDLNQAFRRITDLRLVNIKNHKSIPLNYGISSNISISSKTTVIGRHTQDPARWKRYKGGTAGELWIDLNRKFDFKKLIDLNGNFACPMIVNKRVYFICDHEGISNIYSCLFSGKSLERHTNHKNYYVRNASTDGSSIVYHSGGDIYILNIRENKVKKLKITYNSGRILKSRKFVSPYDYLEKISLNNKGNFINLISRGKAFSMGNWSGPVLQYGKLQGVRYKFMLSLTDDKKILLISDEGGEEHLEIYNSETGKISKRLTTSIGRPIEVKKSPVNDDISIINHKHEIHLIDLSKDKSKLIDRSTRHKMRSNWSYDGRFIAYSCTKNKNGSIIKIYDKKTDKSHEVTDLVNNDSSPVFDPSGNYLAFISIRTFNPIYDSIQFDLNFTVSEKPYIIALNKNVPSPFMKSPEINADKDKAAKKVKNKVKKVKIDFTGIKNRIMNIPTKEALLDDGSIGFSDDKLFYMKWPVRSSHEDSWYDMDAKSGATLYYYDLKTLEEKVFLSNVSSYLIDSKLNKIIVNINNQIKILSTKSIPSKEILSKTTFTQESGTINLNRISLNIDITSEWKQMYGEAWRLQRDHFWVSDMSGINWKKIYNRYYKLIDRVSSRSEFSDLLWEMQGELGTSHCYEMGGDYQLGRYYNIGILGADLDYDKKKKAYKIIGISKGDLWNSPQSPLLRPGLNIKVGDYISQINNIDLNEKTIPNKLLVNEVKKEIQLTVLNKSGKNKRKVSVMTIQNQQRLLYRDWVEKNREYVHKKSKGKIGYLHIPDMGVFGFSEFHRYFLTEIAYDGLIVDVRFNGGGHVSQLLLSKLAKKRLGYDLTRWMGTEPYPSESPSGPMVAITNEYAGSDGDIFSHSWKMMKLGKIIGRRTWGGVIGIWPRNTLVDGTITTQPEFSFWFKDVGWNVENYGAEVDIEVHITPKDVRNNIDTQLDKGIEIVLDDLKKPNALLKADFKNRPDLKLP